MNTNATWKRLVALAAVFVYDCLGVSLCAEPTLRIASVQMEISNLIEINLERIRKGILDAKKENARVVLFPETALSVFDRKTVENVDWSQLDRAMAAVANAADDNDLYVIYGTSTRSDSRGRN